MKKIKTKDKLIPRVAHFVCENCNTEFSSDEFEIESGEKTVREEESGLFSYSRTYYTKSVYKLTTDCPVCGASASVWVDRGLPENKHTVPPWAGGY